MKIKIGTRGSKLALWQANHVADLLKSKGVEPEIVTIETKGDRVLDVSIAKIGSKGVFTEEIEEQLAAGIIDIAVHSAKDMPSTLPGGFELIAFTQRERVNDVLVSENREAVLSTGQHHLSIGTSSTRRIAALKFHYEHDKTVPVRGNLQTRIQRMKEGACDALLLAYAGIHRMGYDDLVVEALPEDTFIPAVGQGSVAIEVFDTINQEKKEMVRRALNHAPTEYCILSERAFLKRMDGGCSIPVFGLARIKGDQMEISGGIVSLDGNRLVQHTLTGMTEEHAFLGEQLAEMVLSGGGDKILSEIKNNLNQ